MVEKPQRPEDLPNFCMLDWNDLYPRLLLAARGRIKRLVWRGERRGLGPGGRTAHDAVQTAVQKFLAGERRWNPRWTAFQNLEGGVSGVISNWVISADNRTTWRTDDDKVGALEARMPTPEDHALWQSERDRLLQYLYILDKDVGRTAGLLLDHDLKSSEAARAMGLEQHEIDALRKRMRRYLITYLDCTPMPQNDRQPPTWTAPGGPRNDRQLTANPTLSPAEKLLAMLTVEGLVVLDGASQAMPEDRSLRHVERLSLDDIVARLRELGVNSAMPGSFRKLVLFDDEDEKEGMDLSDPERWPLPEVLAALDRQGVDHADGVERIRQFIRTGAAGSAAQPATGASERSASAEVPNGSPLDGSHLSNGQHVVPAGLEHRCWNRRTAAELHPVSLDSHLSDRRPA